MYFAVDFWAVDGGFAGFEKCDAGFAPDLRFFLDIMFKLPTLCCTELASDGCGSVVEAQLC